MSGFGTPGNLFGSSSTGSTNPSSFGNTPHPSVGTFGGGGMATTPQFFGNNSSSTHFFGPAAGTSGVTTSFGVSATSTTPSTFGGFGSTFGAATNSTNAMPSLGFGTGQPVQSSFGQQQGFGNTAFGSGFGTAPTPTATPGFGTMNTTTSVGFGGGNNSSNLNVPFSGFPSVPSANSTATATPSAFGGGTGGFGSIQNNASFGGGAVGFPPANSTVAAPFGMTQQQTHQQPGMFAGSTLPLQPSLENQATPTNMLGFPNPTVSTFQETTPFGGGFGSAAANSGGFGNAFSSNNTNPFGFGTASGFGPSSSTNSTGLSFGSSTNVVTRSSQASFPVNTPFPSHTSSGGAVSGYPFGSSFPNTTNTTDSFFPSDNEDMDGDAGMSSASNSPFASPLHPTSTGFVADAYATTLSPVQETMGDAAEEEEANMSPVPTEVKPLSDEDERLANLKAKMQAKKKKLEELKRRKEANSNSSNFDSASAALPLPSDSLVERNMVRFAKAPTDGDGGAPPSAYVDFNDSSRDDREDLENAVSLVGVCQQMCPEDELLRRQREGDLQLLELPQPGTVHPEGWTIRDTAVKRFRRSAADYKLDVPEWVRPPDVLERVCGYLEEWVMERDRQGADPRFPQAESPPPLDVYQFVWDRTRMIRKDFILQNYVGTGGNCDARAVRCHERIARWHAMCEHQLSHIPEFATMQSQQNIQELGQTMKTLNQFYDDTQGRSIIEVPDENGNETRTDLTEFSHGCSSDIVMGETPTDFDGTKLDNVASPAALSQRLLGKHAIESKSHGTAEPEMRGLYILLTINNEGGMEVLKYAARLFKERSAIYHSEPVQLALNIYKAKKEYNYARFFSILKASSTPYLFACIMFKHVELMRKQAFRIMSRTFGSRRKDNGENMYDEYPLKSLQRLLCFEDLEEAREACQHYNITVKPMKIKTSKSSAGHVIVEFIFWRLSEFREPTDPEKGTIITLRPRKMIKTIESKLAGKTRLAVCRGEASGFQETSMPVARARAPAEEDVVQIEAKRAEAARLAAIEAAVERQRMELERAKEQEQKRRREELERLEQQHREQLLARKREEEEKRQAMLLQKQREEEHAKRLADEEERLRQEVEARAIEAERRRREAEENRLAAEREAARLRAEKEQLDRLRQEALRQEQQRCEQERLEREQLKSQKEERKRREAEMKRLVLERQQKEEEERRREATRLAAEQWDRESMEHVKQFSVWLRWRPRMRMHYARTVLSRRNLLALDRHSPTRNSEFGAAISHALLTKTSRQVHDGNEAIVGTRCVADSQSVLEHLLLNQTEPINIASLLRHLLDNPESTLRRMLVSTHGKKTLLLKALIVLPFTKDSTNASKCSLVGNWINTKLASRKIFIDDSSEGALKQVEIRAVVVNSTACSAIEGCDVALFVIPPPWSTLELADDIAEMADRVEKTVRRVVLVLPEDEYMDDPTVSTYVDEYLSQAFVSSEGELARVFAPAKFDGFDFESSLINAVAALLENYANQEQHAQPRLLELVPISKICISCISESLWSGTTLEAQLQGTLVLAHARAAIKEMVATLKDLERNHSVAPWGTWPGREFAEGGIIKNYFGIGQHLPRAWNELLLRKAVEPAVVRLFNIMKGQFSYVIDELTVGAPFDLRLEFDHMLERRQYRRCLQRALLWWGQQQLDDQNCIYLPAGMFEHVVDEVVAALRDTDEEQAKDSAFEVVADSTSADVNPGNDPLELKEWTEPIVTGEVQNEAQLFTPLAELPGRFYCIERSESDKRAFSTSSNSEPPRHGRHGKRQRTAPLNAPMKCSDEVEKSKAFTRKLESYVKGQTVDMIIGDTTLADILQNAPSIDELLGKIS